MTTMMMIMVMMTTMMMMTTQEEEEIMIDLEKEKQAEAGAGILHQEGADLEVEIPDALQLYQKCQL